MDLKKIPAQENNLLSKIGGKAIPNDLSKMEGAATQFEGLLVQEMIKSMWATIPKDGLISGSSEEEMFRDMLNQSFAEQISEGKGIGVKEVLLKDMKRLAKNEEKSIE